MRYEDAAELVKIASEKGLRLSAAPCSSLGRAARTLAHAVASGICGEVRLVYAELDDGPVHKMAFKNWRSDSGAPWPYRDEFEVGCTLEHAGYVVSWLVKMFGAIESVTAFSDRLIEHKLDEEEPLEPAETADASFGLLKFESGVVARLTTTIVATHDHSIRLFGERGVVSLKECWNNSCPVYFRRLMQLRRKTFLSPLSTRVRLPDAAPIIKMSRGNTHMDFMLGVQDLAQSIINGAEPEMSADFALHITEVALALQNAGTDSGTYKMRSRP
jgi:predicted dehydrogenase